MEVRSALSGGEKIEEGDEWSAVSIGEGWPERERKISWSMAAFENQHQKDVGMAFSSTYCL